MKALVLGGSVFIGKRTVQHLVAQGHDVTVLNRGKTPVELPPGVKHLAADRSDTEAMRRVLGNTEWDAVFDISGFVMTAGGSDIEALLDLFDGRVGRYVYVSSVTAYEQDRQVFPWVETDPVSQDGAKSYGGFKVMVETALQDRWQHSGFSYTIIRPAAVYGPDNNIYDMELPMFLRLQQGRPIIVPHNGLVTTSYGHVDDLCRVMVDAAENDNADGEIFNITAEGVSVNHYIQILAEIVGVEPNIVPISDTFLSTLERQPFGHLFNDKYHATLSIDKARQMLDFELEYNFRQGHEQTYQWFLAQGLDKTQHPLRDKIWSATWDFEYEAEIAQQIRQADAPHNPQPFWQSVIHTLRHVILPELPEGWPRLATIQLITLAQYAATQPPDYMAENTNALQQLLKQLEAEHDWITLGERGDEAAVMLECGKLLEEAVKRNDKTVRQTLRTLLIDQLDSELARTGSMISGFRGKLPNE
ncbi:MAG: NAD-dependent epimerase/dehydratase family protein [Pseudomonadota bacterium]